MRILFGLAALLMAGQVYAADGSSGCGPGWYILKENSLVSSSLRATTNGALVPVVTIGMTIGTSNCSKHKIVANEKRSLHFATMNYYELKADIARGSGSYLNAFRHTIGCNQSGQNKFNSALKTNYPRIFPNSSVDPEKALLETYSAIFQDLELYEVCSARIG